MLAGIISLLQDVQPQPQPRPPRVFIDRGGGGGPGWPAFEIVDYLAAAQTFPEIAGEDSVARAARRVEHIRHELERRQRERIGHDNELAAAFLWGAELQRRVYEEQERERVEGLAREVAIQVAADIGAPAMRRGSAGPAAGLALLGIGVAWFAIARARSRGRMSP